MEFKDWLRAELDARKIGPSDLARMAKVPQPTIFRILSGETKDPRTGTVKRIEAALRAQSPPLETNPTITDELAGLWPYLLPHEQAELVAEIRKRVAHNRTVLETMTRQTRQPESKPRGLIRYYGMPRRDAKEKKDGEK